jgi:hypothetical protein
MLPPPTGEKPVLAIVSDLHLQHTSDDAIRYCGEGGEVVECGVRRNVSPGALRRWFSMIHDAVLRQKVDHVELVLAGDIFELHRTPLWFIDNPTGALPIDDDPGPDGGPLCTQVLAILRAVEADNRAFFRVLGRFATEGVYLTRAGLQRLPPGTRVDLHFLPGNHDRLANLWPSVRRRVRELLSMPASDEPFEHVLRRPNHTPGMARQSGYGVAVRHGHEYDRWNFPGDTENGRAMHAGDATYLRPCLGDAMTVEIALRCAVAYRALYASELRTPGAAGDRYRRLYLALLEFDDVRPSGVLFDFLAQQRSKLGGDPLALLRPVIRDVYAQICRDPFFIREAQRLGVGAWFTDPVASMVLKGIEHLPSRWAVALPFAWPFRGADTEIKPAELAQFEPGLHDGSIDTVVAGHTHFPDQVPIKGRRKRRVDSFFLDSGTWRASILYGPGERFGRICGHTVVFCFSGSEHKRDGSEGRRFETWTGHFASGRLGPYAEPRGPLRTAQLHLRFLRLVLEDAGEGVTAGANMAIDLRLGVDGRARHLKVPGVQAGDVVPLGSLAPLPLQRELDGEVWLTGTRTHAGLWEEAQPLPWALQLLPRSADRAREDDLEAPRRKRESRPGFAIGTYELPVRSRDGIRLRLVYTVEPVAPLRRASKSTVLVSATRSGTATEALP